MDADADSSSLERVVLANLDDAYNLARWLMGQEQDARDAVQDACVRALRAFGNFRGGDGRAWFLTIVRNTCMTALVARRRHATLDEQLHETERADPSAADPGHILASSDDVRQVRTAIERLPVELRTVLVLREMDGLSYKQIAGVIASPIGTVMSRLARARQRLAALLGTGAALEDPS